ncbi:translation initiation factor IF-3 [Candidatus Woesebacteria bacterium]|nr:translation initiation factor IF-3 [Candidatus Woesebacteria bacterium]
MSSIKLKTGLPYYRINEAIRAPQVRVIGSDGKQLGVLSREEALAKAKKANLALIEIAPNATPPVAKIIDPGKFKYQEEKKLKNQKKARGGELKEIRFSPFIAENDYQIRLGRVKEFLGERNKVRLVVVFKGRQMGSKPFGYNLLKRIVNELAETISVDMEPKFLGRQLIMVVSPVGKKNAKTKK